MQQAWSVRLKDRLHSGNSGHNSSGGEVKKEICKRFNKGKCSYGPDCAYEHRCSFCFKYGHGVINCHKLRAVLHDKNNRRDNWGYGRERHGHHYHDHDRLRSPSRYYHKSGDRGDHFNQNKNNNNNGKTAKKDSN